VPNLEACIRTEEIERLSATEARAAEAPATASSITRLFLSSFQEVLRVLKTLSLSAPQRLNCRPYRQILQFFTLAFAVRHRGLNCRLTMPQKLRKPQLITSDLDDDPSIRHRQTRR
jgi:hypothetical protein